MTSNAPTSRTSRTASRRRTPLSSSRQRFRPVVASGRARRPALDCTREACASTMTTRRRRWAKIPSLPTPRTSFWRRKPTSTPLADVRSLNTRPRVSRLAPARALEDARRSPRPPREVPSRPSRAIVLESHRASRVYRPPLAPPRAPRSSRPSPSSLFSRAWRRARARRGLKTRERACTIDSRDCTRFSRRLAGVAPMNGERIERFLFAHRARRLVGARRATGARSRRARERSSARFRHGPRRLGRGDARTRRRARRRTRKGVERLRPSRQPRRDRRPHEDDHGRR